MCDGRLPKDLRVHGTYPFDSGKWRRRISCLTLDQVGDLFAIDPDWDEVEGHGRGGAMNSGAIYWWLNKGYVLLKSPFEGGAEPDGSMQLAALEQLGGSPEVKGVQVGDMAVYLHDGTYILIERVVA